MKKFLVSAAIVGLLAGQALLAAQTSATVTVRWTILPFAVISLAGQSGQGSVVATTSIPDPSPADYQRGFIVIQDAVRLTVLSNTSWTVYAQALGPDLGRSFDGGFTWPLEALEAGVNGRFIRLSQTPQPLTRGGRGTHTLPVDYRVTIPTQPLPPGDYQVTLLYTVIAD
ncbi:TPA: hypothetical protein DCL37_05520 [Candidatus Acetothermia bacterium]|nr:hypothetical protein [Candidatus Acetothermia bacterium]